MAVVEQTFSLVPGFGKIYLYDHNSTVPLASEIPELVKEGYVEPILFSGFHTRWNQSEGFADNLGEF